MWLAEVRKAFGHGPRTGSKLSDEQLDCGLMAVTTPKALSEQSMLQSACDGKAKGRMMLVGLALQRGVLDKERIQQLGPKARQWVSQVATKLGGDVRSVLPGYANLAPQELQAEQARAATIVRSCHLRMCL